MIFNLESVVAAKLTVGSRVVRALLTFFMEGWCVTCDELDSVKGVLSLPGARHQGLVQVFHGDLIFCSLILFLFINNMVVEIFLFCLILVSA